MSNTTTPIEKRSHQFLIILTLVILLILPSVVMREWFLPFLPQTHDAEAHISRAAVFARSLQEGNILPRWAGYFNWGYGTPSIMFLYPGPPYLSALINLSTGLSFISIYKLLMIASYAASGVLWYLWLKEVGFTKLISLGSTVFYLLAPYRLVNIFVRGALAEHLGFLFFPAIMLGATKVFNGKSHRWSVLFPLVIAGLILTHNLSALLYVPLVLFYPIFLKRTEKNFRVNSTTVFYFVELVIIGLAMAGFFWIPVIFESKYTLASWIFPIRDWYADHFLTVTQLIWSPWGYGLSLPGTANDGMTFQVGVAQWTVLILGMVWGALSLWKKGVERDKRSWMVAGITLVSIGVFFSLPYSSFVWRSISILPLLQFPWRFLAYVVIGSSLSAAYVLTRTISNPGLTILLMMLPIMFTVKYWRVAGPSNLTERFLAVDYVGTSDTGETTPVWAVRFQEKPPKYPLEVVSTSGRVDIEVKKRLLELHQFDVDASAPSVLVDNTLYFPGWKVFIDGQSTPIEFQDQNWRGLITFALPQGRHRVEVTFMETPLRKLSNALSILAFSVALARVRMNKSRAGDLS